MTAGFVLPDGRSGSVAIGLADLERKTPMRVGDRMLAGSIGKTYFSAVALQLVAEGKLDLDTKIKKWLGSEPWFARLPNGADITLRMLMNHTSGVPEHVLDPTFIAAVKKEPDKHWSPPELVAYVLGKKPHFPAGEGWSYADTNYILAGMIIERVTGRDLYSLVKERLLDRFHLEATSPSTSRVLAGLIPGHSGKGSPFGIEGPSIKDGKVIFNPQCEWAGGGFVSTSEDLARWARLLYGGDVLSTQSLEKLLAGVPAKTGRGDQYGLGVQIRLSPWGKSLGHGGWFPGYLSEMEYFPATRLAVAVQFNTDDMRSLGKNPRFFVGEVARAILANVPEYPLAERTDRPQIFAPGVVSTEDDEVGGVFNPDQTEFYFSKLSRYTTSPRVGLLCVSRRRDGRWMTPEVLPFSGRYLDYPPRLSPDGSRMYFASSRPLPGSQARVLRIWRASRKGESWGEPEPLPSPINQDTSWNWGASVASDGTIYFTSTRDQSGHTRIYSFEVRRRDVFPAGAAWPRDQFRVQRIRPVHFTRWEAALLRRDRRPCLSRRDTGRKRFRRAGSCMRAARSTLAEMKGENGPRRGTWALRSIPSPMRAIRRSRRTASTSSSRARAHHSSCRPSAAWISTHSKRRYTRSRMASAT